MALLVTDQGEIDSLRTLLNATHQIPRDLVLKLYTGPSTAPTEQDLPAAGAYFEPFDASNSRAAGTPTTGYDSVIDVRTEEDQNFTSNYGILLNGNRWTIATKLSAATSKNVTGTSGTYSITVAPDNTDIKKGDYIASGGGISENTYVVDIDGNTLEISQKLTANMTAVAKDFGVGRTTASYPEQIFTFDAAAGNVHGYYLSRANNLPTTIQGVADAGTAAASGTFDVSDCKGVIGNTYIELKDDKTSPTAISAGAQNSYELTVASATGIEVGQIVEATNVPTQTRVVGVDGTTIYIDKAITGGNASGNLQCVIDVAKDITIGQVVDRKSGQSGPNAFPAGTKVVGIDYKTKATEQGPRVWLDQQLTDNIGTASSNANCTLTYSVVTTDPSGTNTVHNLNAGDVIYIAQGTGGNMTAQHYTVFSAPTTSSFTTTPALQGTGKATIYHSIFFAEKFTNGPYQIQNSGDQIKVTLNVSLD